MALFTNELKISIGVVRVHDVSLWQHIIQIHLSEGPLVSHTNGPLLKAGQRSMQAGRCSGSWEAGAGNGRLGLLQGLRQASQVWVEAQIETQGLSPRRGENEANTNAYIWNL